MSLSMISFIIQCCSAGLALIIFLCYFIKGLKIRFTARKTLKDLERQKRKKEMYLKLKKEFEGND